MIVIPEVNEFAQKNGVAKQRYSEEMQDIISAPPSWLIRWGMALLLVMLLIMVSLSALIHYPDVIKTQLKINSLNAPKPLVTKISGKLVKLLIKDNQKVAREQSLAYLESTADHDQVLLLLELARQMQQKIYSEQLFSLESMTQPLTLQFGELQAAYQNFYQSYLAFKASVGKGFYLEKRAFLQRDLEDIKTQRKYITTQKSLREKEYDLAKQEYEVHQKLTEQKVETPMELRKQEASLLSRQYPLQQAETDLLNNSTSYAAKTKELAELDNQINEEKLKFTQALNSLISDIELWKSKYVVSASQPGIVAFTGSLQVNQFIEANTELFYINQERPSFFGEMPVPQYNMGKIQTGQEVLIKLNSYPYEEYGIIHGKIDHITDIPVKDSVFYARVNIGAAGLSKLKRPVHLKNGMTASAEIITENASLLTRLLRNVVKIME